MGDLLVAKYFDFLLYNEIKAGFLKSAKESLYNLSTDFTNSDLLISYGRLVFSSQDLMKTRTGGLTGLPSPAVALWRTTEPVIPQEAYGRSVMKRSVYVPDPLGLGNDYYGVAPVVDWEFEYHLYAESYFNSYISRVSQDATTFDMLRYVTFDMSDYIPGFVTIAELRMGKASRNTAMMEGDGVRRSITLDIPLTLKVTVPLMGSNFGINSLQIYLNSQQVYTWSGS
jgi:hypothetical protein